MGTIEFDRCDSDVICGTIPSSAGINVRQAFNKGSLIKASLV